MFSLNGTFHLGAVHCFFHLVLVPVFTKCPLLSVPSVHVPASSPETRGCFLQSTLAGLHVRGNKHAVFTSKFKNMFWTLSKTAFLFQNLAKRKNLTSSEDLLLGKQSHGRLCYFPLRGTRQAPGPTPGRVVKSAPLFSSATVSGL